VCYKYRRTGDWITRGSISTHKLLIGTLYAIFLGKKNHLEKACNLTIGCNVKSCLAIIILEIYVAPSLEQ